MPANTVIALCALAQIVALIVVGTVSDGFARHVLQTSPDWIVAGLALNNARSSKWVALPVFLFWLAVMTLIWLYLLGIARIVHGHFSDIEVAMTLVVAGASLLGLVAAVSVRSSIRWYSATVILVVAGAIQVGVMAVSMRTAISNDTALINWIHAR